MPSEPEYVHGHRLVPKHHQTKPGSMPSDHEYLPLSLLSQVDYCPRRAGLIMNERVWVENSDTAKGRMEHERVHTQRVERRGDRQNLYEYAVFTNSLGLSGKCDCVEATRAEGGCIIPAAAFPVTLFPVEFKHGMVREESEYQIQLCAQALCLEEMYGAVIPEGAIFYITAHRRSAVKFTAELRERVIDASQTLHQMRQTLTTPAPQSSPKCKRCSLREYCMPAAGRSAKEYCRRLAQEARGEGEI